MHTKLLLQMKIYKSLDSVIPVLEEKKSTKFCRVTKSHCGETAAPCSSCFEQGLSTSHCWHTLSHCGPGVFWMTEALDKRKKVPQCYSVIILPLSVYNCLELI